MRWMLLLAIIGGSVMTAQAETYVYVSMAPEQKIQIYQMDAQDGRLSSVDALSVDGAPGCLTFDPSQRFLFASLRTTSSLASFEVDPGTGKLKQISTVALPTGENAAFVATDRSGRWLLSASYMAGNCSIRFTVRNAPMEWPVM